MKLTNKNQNLLNSNYKTVRHNGKVYRLFVQKLGGMLLANFQELDATNKLVGELFNLFDRKSLSREVRNLVEEGLVS